MDLDALRAFVKVAELASFTAAAVPLGRSKARVSAEVQALEASLGTRLFSRTTRSVRLTSDGEQLLPRARRLLADADEVGALFAAPRVLRGRVRVDLPERLARDSILPRVGELLAAHPHLELAISTTDRRVEVAREGFDCVLRVGAMPDSSLSARRLGAMPMINVASPEYLRKHGIPRTLADLDRHFIVHYSTPLGADPPAFEHPEGDGWIDRPMRASVSVNGVDAYHALCLAGLGIIQAPRLGLMPAVRAGLLVEVLPTLTAAPMPVSLVHPHGRNVPSRVRVVMNWIADVVSPLLAGS
jgi:DNA-binding transcriptional LysR family regulator